MEFSTEFLAVTAGIFLFAAFIHGSIGFGFPMVATPLLALFTDIQTAIILTLIPNLLVNIVSIVSEGGILPAIRRHISLAILAMTGSAIGTLILIFTNSELFKILLALAIFIYLFADRIKLNLLWTVLIIYSLESKHSKSEIIQASNFCFLLGKTIQLILFSIHSIYTAQEFSSSLPMLLVVSVALFAGIKIKKKIKADAYQKVLRIFLFILAALLVFQVLL